MSQYIDKSDYDATVHADIIDSLTRKDDSILDICEDRAIDQMKSYLSGRYDTTAIFAARGGDRQPLVLMMCLDLAVYHIYCVGNPQKLSQMRKDRYDRATEWLKAVSKGQISVNGVPEKGDEEKRLASEYHLRSNPKRTNHF